MNKVVCELLNTSPDHYKDLSPIVIVPKPNEVRICDEYKRTINSYIEADQFSLPNADKLLNKTVQ